MEDATNRALIIIWRATSWGNVSEKDLGIVSNDLKVGTECNQASSKAKRMLGILKLDIVNKTPLIMVSPYETLEYCVPAWSPYCVKDKNTLERIQFNIDLPS